MRLIGILGGTFDPIHNAHLRLALEAQKQLNLDQVRFIPANIPPHRDIPVASSIDRQNMIELAIRDKSGFCIDLRELETNEISYSINTLKSLKQELPDDALCLILGRDAFNKIDKWKDWLELIHYAHIIVANRPIESSSNVSTQLQEWIERHEANDQNEIKNKLSGCVYFINIPMLDISSSTIRQYYKEEKTVDNFLPTSIQQYINNNHLYMDTA